MTRESGPSVRIIDVALASQSFPVPTRVVSLVPSLTETLFDLGAGRSVAGATNFCLFPEDGLRTVPRVGGTKNPDIKAIQRLEPEIVYMNLEENLRRHAEAIAHFAPVVTSEPKSVDDVLELIPALGHIHDRDSDARRLCDEIEQSVASLAAQRHSFTFACPIWKSPWMWCGGDTYVSSLLSAAGGTNVIADLERYPELSLDAILEQAPTIIFLPDEPYAFSAREAGELRERWPGRVIGPFPGHLFTWHGSRTRHGLRALREMLGGKPN